MSVDMGTSPTIQPGTVIQDESGHYIVAENEHGTLELRRPPAHTLE